jgi:hypothetical protein
MMRYTQVLMWIWETTKYLKYFWISLILLYVLNTTTNSKDAVFLDLELSNRIDRKFLRIKKNTIIFIKSTEF